MSFNIPTFLAFLCIASFASVLTGCSNNDDASHETSGKPAVIEDSRSNTGDVSSPQAAPKTAQGASETTKQIDSTSTKKPSTTPANIAATNPNATATKTPANGTPTIPKSDPPPSVGAPTNGGQTNDQTSLSLEQQIENLVVPAPWLANVTPKWDMNRPWKEGRIEIRRLLAFGKDQQRKEAIKLTWDYLQKDDIGNGHEYPMYLHLGGESVWSVVAHRWFLAQEHEHVPVYALKSLAAIYTDFGEFELAEQQIHTAMKHLPDPPWRVLRKAEFHEAYGDLYAAWGKLDQAKHHYAEAIRIYPTAKPKWGAHELPAKAKKAQSKLDLISFKSLADATLKDGVYREHTLGYTGPMNLTVSIRQGRVANIQIQHTEKIDQNACEIIPARITKQQTLRIDAISGATVTTDAIVSGTYRALRQAGLK